MVKVLDPVTAEPIATWMVHQHRVTSLAINALCTDVSKQKPHTAPEPHSWLANTCRRVACAQIVIGNRGGHVQLLHVETSDDDTTLPRVTVVRMYHSEKCVSRRRARTCEPLGPHSQPFFLCTTPHQPQGPVGSQAVHDVLLLLTSNTRKDAAREPHP